MLMPNLSILAIGFSGLIAQVVLLRELLVSFYGSELVIGLVLANWLALEAAGVFLAGRFLGRLKNSLYAYIGLQGVFVAGLPLAVYLARACKDIMNIPFGQALSLPQVFLASLLILFLPAFSHGALFSAFTYLMKERQGIIGRVYTLETLGTVIGGLAFTYIFIPFLNSFQIAFFVGLLNIATLYFFARKDPGLKLKFGLTLAAGLFILISFAHEAINRASIQKQFRTNRVLDYRNTVYGNIAVVKKFSQYTIYYNANPAIITPYPNQQFAQDFGNLPLLFQGAPKDVLIIGGGCGGLLSEVLKYKVERVDYAELDPMLIRMVEKHRTFLTDLELRDRRVKVAKTDGRLFLNNSLRKYDCILIGLPGPHDLSLNRFFTGEFFQLAKGHLRKDGVLAFSLPGSLTYLSGELNNLNASVLNALKAGFAYVRVIPGDYNIYLAASTDINSVGTAEILRRMAQNEVQSAILIPAYLEYRLDRKWQDWFDASVSAAESGMNADLRPKAVFAALALSNKEFFPQLIPVFKFLNRMNLKRLLFFLIILTGLIFAFSKRRGSLNIPLAYSIGTTGFFSMLASVILIFSFQVFYGYLYYWLGIFISIFMSGIALGSGLITARPKYIGSPARMFAVIEAATAVFSISLAALLARFDLPGILGWFTFGALFCLAGMLTGAEFALATRSWSGGEDEPGSTAGTLYAADLAGGWLAGALGTFLFLPVIGILNSCVLLGALKLGSLAVYILTRRAN